MYLVYHRSAMHEPLIVSCFSGLESDVFEKDGSSVQSTNGLEHACMCLHWSGADQIWAPYRIWQVVLNQSKELLVVEGQRGVGCPCAFLQLTRPAISLLPVTDLPTLLFRHLQGAESYAMVLYWQHSSTNHLCVENLQSSCSRALP